MEGISFILKAVGFVLIILGLSSGWVLFSRAVKGQTEIGTHTSTLWALFLLGIIGGIGLYCLAFIILIYKV
jgi:hypothetical protein